MDKILASVAATHVWTASWLSEILKERLEWEDYPGEVEIFGELSQN